MRQRWCSPSRGGAGGWPVRAVAGGWLVTAAAAGGLVLLLAGCPEDNPRYCTADEQCQDPAREGYDPSKPHCHGEGNFCYEGCTTHAECKDTSKAWYRAGRPFCDPATSDCVAAPADGAVDADGQGLDGPPEAGPDALDAGTDVDAPATKLDNGQPCQKGSWCKSGFCADKVCCDTACSGTCRACDLAGSKGACTLVPASAGPHADCPGDTACGDGTCDGAGGCTYPNQGKTCASSCAAGMVTVSTCDAAHACKAAAPVSCAPTVCDAAGKACLVGCQDHTDCVKGSLCDRSGAHTATQAGLGTCVATGKVVTVGASEEIADALKKVTAAKPYVSIPPKTAGVYTKQLVLSGATVAGKTVHLVGTGSAGKPVIVKPSSINVPAISVQSSMTVTVQGLQLQSASGTAGDGVYCQGTTSTTSKLTVLESTIQDNKGHGVVGSYCDVTLRRNLVLSNQAGGVKLSDGTFVIVNNVVAKNGDKLSSVVGGFYLSPTKSTGNTFYNNTVAYNESSGTGAGVNCPVNVNVVNSIIYSNGSSPLKSCTATYSNVEGGATGAGNINNPPLFVDEAKGNFSLKTGSTSIDAGKATTGVTVIDLTGGKRLKGTATDLGAYEVN